MAHNNSKRDLVDHNGEAENEMDFPPEDEGDHDQLRAQEHNLAQMQQLLAQL